MPRAIVCRNRLQRPMCVCVTAVNWKISAAVRRTRPSAISLRWRSSRPLAAKTNITNAAAIEISARRSTASDDPEVGAVAAVRRLDLLEYRLGVLARHRTVPRDDVDERVPHALAHRLRAAHVDVAAVGEQTPDERPLRSQPVLHVLARALSRRHHVHV